MRYFAGVDIGGMSIKIGIVNDKGSIISESYFSTNKGEKVNETVRKILEEIKKLENKSLVKIESIGIGIPGITNTEEGIVVSAVNLGWKNINLVEEFSKQTNLKVSLLNDANAAAFGEFKFATEEKVDNFVLITLGTGIGSGIILNHKLYLGYGSAAGEIGHIIIKERGLKCNCGNKGCFEKYASATALMNQIKYACKKNKNSILAKISDKNKTYSGKIVFEAYEEGCQVAKKVIDNYVEYIASGLISVINVIHPQVIAIGGGVSNAGDKLINKIQEKIDKYIEASGFYPNVKIRKAKLMNNAGIIGAASFMMENE